MALTRMSTSARVTDGGFSDRDGAKSVVDGTFDDGGYRAGRLGCML